MSSEDERYDLLIGFLEGELDDDERELVEEELSAPGEAQERLEAYRGLSAALAELEPPAPSAEAKDRAYAAVLAAMAESSAAPSQEDEPREERAAPAKSHASQPAPAPRGQLLRFLSATAAAALVMISALFYLRDLESPQRAKVALAPKKVALEEVEAQDEAKPRRAAPVAQQAAGLADRDLEAKAAEDQAGGKANQQPSGFGPEAEAVEAEGAEDEALALRLREERSRLERERELTKSLEKTLERSSAQREELLSPQPTRAMSAPTPGQAALDEDQARRPAAPPQRPGAEPKSPAPEPERKDFGSRNDDTAKEAPADAPAAGGEQDAYGFSEDRDAAPETTRGARKKLGKGAPGAKRKARRRSRNEDGKPGTTGANSDGVQPEADSSVGGGGGGGGGSSRDTPGSLESERPRKGKKKSKTAGEPDGAPQPREPSPSTGRRGGALPELGGREDSSLRMRRLQAAQLQPAWIVTRGDQRILYVMEGSKLTQAPFPHPPNRVRSRSERPLAVQQLQVTALEVQRRALATKRKPVDLSVLERREDLLEIAKLELANDVPKRRGRSAGPGTQAAPSGGAPAGKAGEGPADKNQAEPEESQAEPEESQAGKRGPEAGGKAEGREAREPRPSPRPNATPAKPPLPPPAPGRERAAHLLRLLGALEGPQRPSVDQLRRLVRETERRQVKARRRR